MRDILNDLRGARGLSPVVATDNTPLVSQIHDRRGFNGSMAYIATGTLADADATFAVLVEHGDDSGLSDAAAVPDEDLVGDEATASFTFAADNVVKSIGYVGIKRYLRITITPDNNTGNAPLCLIFVDGAPNHGPTGQQ